MKKISSHQEDICLRALIEGEKCLSQS